MKTDQQIQTAVRLPESYLERLDKLAERMSQAGLNRVTRAEAHRFALLEGIKKLEKVKKR
jgi:predicted DNA-binding protein